MAALTEKLKSDVFYVQCSCHPERLHLYGVPEDMVMVACPLIPATVLAVP